MFGVEPGDVTVRMRSTAKMISYGLAYGMEAYGLGQRLNIPTEEAAVILNAYFDAFPNVRAYMERTVKEARMRGYTETLFGRRRPIPELSNSNYRIRQAGERQAMNAGIQGLAADIFKVALVRLDRALEDGRYASRIVLQVHDEVLLEVPDGRARRGRPADRRHDAGGGRAAGAAGGQRVVGPDLGRRQGVSAGADEGEHWFEPIADHLGRAYLRYSHTKGTVQEVDHLVARPAAGARAAGARRGLRARPPRPRAGPAGHRVPRHRRRAPASSSWPARTPRPARPSPAWTLGSCATRPRSTP